MNQSGPTPETEHTPVSTLGKGLLYASHHYLALFNIIVGLFVFGALLPPVLMKAGFLGPAKVLYSVYGFTCHQLPQRSYFLFGRQLMYPLEQLLDAWPGASSLWEQRAIIGDPVFGYKVALANRCSTIYPTILLVGLLLSLRRRPLKPLSLIGLILLFLPMAIDGGSHFVSEVTRLGFREDNFWLQWLTRSAFAPEFYAGHAVGSFNWLMRTVTGALFGLAVVWFVYPILRIPFQNHSQVSE